MLTTAQDIATFALAGRAIFTVSSTNTGARYTYRVAAPAPKDDGQQTSSGTRRFVSLLTGADNCNDYTYIGTIDGTAFRTTKASKLSADAPPVKAIAYLCSRVLAHPEAPLPEGLEVRHEGKCGCCGRKLTVPSSIDRGIGPECADKLGLV